MPQSDLDAVREACEGILAGNYPGLETYLNGKTASAIARLVLAMLPIVHVNQGHIGMRAIAACAREIRGGE